MEKASARSLLYVGNMDLFVVLGLLYSVVVALAVI